MLYEVITGGMGRHGQDSTSGGVQAAARDRGRFRTVEDAAVITSYSIHYTKLYDTYQYRHQENNFESAQLFLEV